MSKLTKPSEGYFLAKRQVAEKLEGHIGVLLEKSSEAKLRGDELSVAFMEVEVRILEKVRNQIRNTMLWDTSKGE